MTEFSTFEAKSQKNSSMVRMQVGKENVTMTSADNDWVAPEEESNRKVGQED